MARTDPTPETVRLIKNRSLGLCERCRDEPGVLTHHRCPRGRAGLTGSPWLNYAGNLVRLGVQCNSWIETQQRDAARRTGWLVRRSIADQLGGSERIPVVDTTGTIWILTDYGIKRLYVPETDYHPLIEANSWTQEPLPRRRP